MWFMVHQNMNDVMFGAYVACQRGGDTEDKNCMVVWMDSCVENAQSVKYGF